MSEMPVVAARITAKTDSFESAIRALNQTMRAFSDTTKRTMEETSKSISKSVDRALQESARNAKRAADQTVQIEAQLNDRATKLTKSRVDQEIIAVTRRHEAERKLIKDTVEDHAKAMELIKRAELLTSMEIGQIKDRARHEEAEKAATKLRDQKSMGTGLIVGAATVGVAAGMSGMASALRTMSEFEAKLNEIRAVSSMTGKEFVQVKNLALELGAKTKFSATEAAAGMGELAKAGFTVTETMAAIPGVMALAAAGGVAVGEAAELTAGIIRGFGLEASKAAEVADMLAKAANVSAVDIRDLALSFKYISSVAKAGNQDLAQMTGAVAILGNQMIKADQAGTTLRSALLKLVDPSKESQTIMAKMHLTIQDVHGKMLPLSMILDQLRTKMKNYTDVQKEMTISQIFGTEAASGMLALLNTSKDAYDQTVASMAASAGAAKVMADIMNQGVKFSLEQIGAAAETAKIKLGTELAPAFNSAATGAASAINVFNNLPPALQTTAAAATVGGTAFLGLTGMMAAGTLGMGAMRIAATALGITLKGLFLGPVGIGITALSLLAAGYVGLKSAQEQVNFEARERVSSALKEVDTTTGQINTMRQLIAEHDVLVSKKRLTHGEAERLRQLNEQLKTQFPQLAAVIAQSGNAHLANIPAINAEIQALENLRRKKLEVIHVERQMALKEVRDAGTKLAQAQHAKSVLAKKVGTGGGGRVSDMYSGQYEGAVAEEEAANAAFNAATQRAGNANQAWDAANTIIKPKVSPVSSVQLGNAVVMPPHRGGGGKNAAANSAKQAANDAYQVDKANIEQRLRLQQVLDEGIYNSAKAQFEARKTHLKSMLDLEKLSNGEYLQQTIALQHEETALETAYQAQRLAREIRAKQDELREVRQAISAGATDRKKDATRLEGEIIVQQKQLENIKKDGIAKQNQITADGTAQIAAYIKTKADEQIELNQSMESTINGLQEDSLAKRLQANKLNYSAQIAAAKKKYLDTTAIKNAWENADLKTTEEYHATVLQKWQQHAGTVIGAFGAMLDASSSVWDKMVAIANIAAADMSKHFAKAFGPMLDSATEEVAKNLKPALEGIAEGFASATKAAWTFMTTNPFGWMVAAGTVAVGMLTLIVSSFDAINQKAFESTQKAREFALELEKIRNSQIKNKADKASSDRDIAMAELKHNNAPKLRELDKKADMLRAVMGAEEAKNKSAGNSDLILQGNAAYQNALQQLNEVGIERARIIVAQGEEELKIRNEYVIALNEVDKAAAFQYAANEQLKAEVSGDIGRQIAADRIAEMTKMTYDVQDLVDSGALKQEDVAQHVADRLVLIERKLGAQLVKQREDAMQKLAALEESSDRVHVAQQKGEIQQAQMLGILTPQDAADAMARLDDFTSRKEAQRAREAAEFYRRLSEDSHLSAEERQGYEMQMWDEIGKAQSIAQNGMAKAVENYTNKVNAKYEAISETFEKQRTLLEQQEEAEKATHDKKMLRLEAQERGHRKELLAIEENIRREKQKWDEERKRYTDESKHDDAKAFNKAMDGMVLGDDELTYDAIEAKRQASENAYTLEQISQEEYLKAVMEASVKKAVLAKKEVDDEQVTFEERTRIQTEWANAYRSWQEYQLQSIDTQEAKATDKDMREKERLDAEIARIELKKSTEALAVEELEAKYKKLYKAIDKNILENKNAWDLALKAITSGTDPVMARIASQWKGITLAINAAIRAKNAFSNGGGTVGIPTYNPTPVKAATGGLFAGGVPGKDSIAAQVMPGELIVNNPITQGLSQIVPWLVSMMNANVPFIGAGNIGNQVVSRNVTFTGDLFIRTEDDLRRIKEYVSEELSRDMA